MCLQVFDSTPAARDGTLESGDELVGINGVNVKVRRRRRRIGASLGRGRLKWMWRR